MRYSYFEGPWPVLLSHSGMHAYLPVASAGLAAGLLDAAQLRAIRSTDRAYAVKYDGFVAVPRAGLYRFFAPEHLYDTTMDAGYDLRVWIDDQEWFPNPDLHAENTWSVALEKGLHRFHVSYTDFRWKSFRNEYSMAWRPEQVWQGVPVLDVAGPDIGRQPLPASWLRCQTP